MPEKEKKTSKILKQILESLWLILGIIALGIAIKESISSGIKNSLIYYGFVLIALFFYSTRRNQRLKG